MKKKYKNLDWRDTVLEQLSLAGENHELGKGTYQVVFFETQKRKWVIVTSGGRYRSVCCIILCTWRCVEFENCHPSWKTPILKKSKCVQKMEWLRLALKCSQNLPSNGTHKRIWNFPSSSQTGPRCVKGGTIRDGGKAHLDANLFCWFPSFAMSSYLVLLETHKASLPHQELTASQGRDRPLRVSWPAPAWVCVWEAAPPWLCPWFLMGAIEHLEVSVPVLESHPLPLVTYTCVTLAIPFPCLARPQFPHLQNGTVPRADS